MAALKLRRQKAVFQLAHLTAAFFEWRHDAHGHVIGNSELENLKQILATSPQDLATFRRLRHMDPDLKYALAKSRIDSVEYGEVADQQMPQAEKEIALLLGSTLSDAPVAPEKVIYHDDRDLALATMAIKEPQYKFVHYPARYLPTQPAPERDCNR